MLQRNVKGLFVTALTKKTQNNPSRSRTEMLQSIKLEKFCRMLDKA